MPTSISKSERGICSGSLTISGVAAEIDCSPDTVRRMIARGELPAYRVGRRLIRIKRSDIEKIMRPVTRLDLVTIGGGQGAA